MNTAYAENPSLLIFSTETLFLHPFIAYWPQKPREIVYWNFTATFRPHFLSRPPDEHTLNVSPFHPPSQHVSIIIKSGVYWHTIGIKDPPPFADG